jgi:glutathione S-transferase
MRKLETDQLSAVNRWVIQERSRMTDAPIDFYYNPQSRAAIVHWMLEELGVPFNMHVLSFDKGEHKSPEFLAINPMGKVPTIRHGDVVVTEYPAICAYLADAFPAAGLAPAIGDPRRGTYLRWLFFAGSCIEPALWDRALQREPGKPSMIGYGSFEDVLDTAAKAVTPGPYLLGDMFSAADVVFGSGIMYGMMFNIFPQRPEFTAYAERLKARPACQRAETKDHEVAASMTGAI